MWPQLSLHLQKVSTYSKSPPSEEVWLYLHLGTCGSASRRCVYSGHTSSAHTQLLSWSAPGTVDTPWCLLLHHSPSKYPQIWQKNTQNLSLSHHDNYKIRKFHHRITSRCILGEGGGPAWKFYTERLRPEVQNPYPFIYLEQNAPLSCTPRKSQNNKFPIIATFFRGFQWFSFSCSKGASFFVFCINCHFCLFIHSVKWQFSLPFSILQA